MRITSVSACGLLTFEDFHLDLDEHLTLIVGPNGAGKSNFDRLFEIVIRVIQAADRESPDLRQMLQRYLGGRRANLDDRGIEIRLAYQLTADFEKALLTSFVRTCVVATLLGNNFGFDTSGIEDWADGITEDHFVQLFLGELVVHHGGTPDAQWECAIEFGVEGVQYRWEMMGARRDSLVRAEDRLRTDLQGLQLSDRLPAGLAPTGTSAASTPVEPFTTSMILPDPNTMLSCSLVFGRQPPPRSFRYFAELIGVDPVGAAAGQNNHYGLAHVLWMIFQRASITTSDARLLPSGSHSWSSESASLQLGAEGRIPEALLRLKNGRSTEFQAFRSVQSLFHLFTHGRTMEVAMVPAGAEGSEAVSEDALTVTPVVLVSVNPRSADKLDELYPQVPIEFAGAGAWEALVLAFVLGSQRSSFIVLDEPAVALHPNLQRALMTHLQGLSAQIVVITHSPYFFPLAEDQGKTRIVRFDRGERSDTHPAVVDKSLMTKMVPKLRQTGNERIAFASKVVLTEGKIDQAGLRSLAEASKIDIDGSNIAVVDCSGRENIPDYARFCAGLGLKYLAVQDGDAGKPDAAKGVAAVRTAVAESELGTLFEFAEDIETALGDVEKDVRAVSLAMREAATQPQVPPEILTLRQRLFELAAAN
jgi:energy-coupling factor transporter ATP-binding protein EcfA2